MGIGSILGQVGGFITGIVPRILELGQALTMLLGIIKVGVAERDVGKVREAAQSGQRLGLLFQRLGTEITEFFRALEGAVGEDSPGGRDLTGVEIKALADEGDDALPLVKDIAEETGDLMSAVRKLV